MVYGPRSTWLRNDEICRCLSFWERGHGLVKGKQLEHFPSTTALKIKEFWILGEKREGHEGAEYVRVARILGNNFRKEEMGALFTSEIGRRNRAICWLMNYFFFD